MDSGEWVRAGGFGQMVSRTLDPGVDDSAMGLKKIFSIVQTTTAKPLNLQNYHCHLSQLKLAIPN